ncbi:MAG: zinc-binding dehydrogenase [Candidatus Marinimicrobia bacterium]|nr:zinc-binding dehydrogenase [Candidatus Neomarinimicrobiota bacterium]
MDTMQQVIITKYGPPEVLQVQQAPIPEPGTNDVLIRIHYAGINFSEIMARMKLYPGAPKPPCGVGSEASGEVLAVGENVTQYKPGQHVMTFCRFGSYSTHCCVNESMVMPLPKNFSLKQGGAFPLVYITAYMMMFQLGNLQSGEAILIHGAGGGVGTAAIQLAQSVGAGMICTASKWKHDKLKAMGVHHCIDYNSEDVAARVMEITKNTGVDLIIDPLGGKSWKTGYTLLSPMGKLIVYGDQKFVSGYKRNPVTLIKEALAIPRFNPGLMLGQNKSVMGYHLGKLAGAEHKIKFAVEKLIALAESEKITPVIDRVFHYTDAAGAHRYIQDRKNFGKVLLDFSG